MMPLDNDQLEHLDQQAKTGQFTHEDYQLLRRLFATHRDMVTLLKNSNTSLDDVYNYLASAENDTASDGTASDRSESVSQDPDE